LLNLPQIQAVSPGTVLSSKGRGASRKAWCGIAAAPGALRTDFHRTVTLNLIRRDSACVEHIFVRSASLGPGRFDMRTPLTVVLRRRPNHQSHLDLHTNLIRPPRVLSLCSLELAMTCRAGQSRWGGDSGCTCSKACATAYPERFGRSGGMATFSGANFAGSECQRCGNLG
jgi:hypothetical protein